ncbi:MAG: ATPase [Zetaproteobacteria bacterium]|nr:ATPase [Pseudobdellovibrionaceae bacterium]
MQKKSSIRIGNASGFWGDDPKALHRQLSLGSVDYITMDFLAEITMCILKKQMKKKPSLGYATDFVSMIDETLEIILEKKVKIISNAGGINPKKCAEVIKERAKAKGLEVKIAVVFGDDILHDLESIEREGVSFQNMETGESFDQVKDRIEASNVYFGALPVVKALDKWDPDIVITGRVTDTGISLAPMIHEFSWSMTDWNKLASGIVAGHILECGSQVSGGNFTDWQKIENYKNIGYPIVEVNKDSSFTVSKHPNTGGLISSDTVKEQIFYEMGDPKNYISPDVIADFSTIKIEQKEKNKVFVYNTKGRPATPYYKVSMAYENGYKTSGSLIISGPNAILKAKKFAEVFWERCEDSFLQTSTDFIGWNACHQSLCEQEHANEILLSLGVRDHDEKKVRRFSKSIPSLILSGPPGVAVLGAPSKIQSIISYWPSLIDKKFIKAIISMENENKEIENTFVGEDHSILISEKDIQRVSEPSKNIEETIASDQQDKTSPLSKICLTRSGDKGDSVNIGVIARNERCYSFLKEILTAQKIKNIFQQFCKGPVTRYSLDNLGGLNFILDQSLGGGGSSTLRVDAQGKTFAQALQTYQIHIPNNILSDV